MSEPDFEQITRELIEAYGIGRLDEWCEDNSRLIAYQLIETLRQVWNARGAADAIVVAEDRDYFATIKALDC